MPREKLYINIDADFKSFLEQLKDETGTPISRIIEIATKEKYKAQYQEYLEKYKKK